MQMEGHMTPRHEDRQAIDNALDIRIGLWHTDTEAYRAAYIQDCVLTGPEHQHLSDRDLLKEARAEYQRSLA